MEDFTGLQVPGIDSIIVLSVMLLGATILVWFTVKGFVSIIKGIFKRIYIYEEPLYPLKEYKCCENPNWVWSKNDVCWYCLNCYARQ